MPFAYSKHKKPKNSLLKDGGEKQCISNITIARFNTKHHNPYSF